MSKVERLFSFADWARDHPSDSLPGDRVDIQFENHRAAISALAQAIQALVRADGKLNAEVLPFPIPKPAQSARSTPTGPPVLGPNTGGFYAGDIEGATATAADYAQVSIEWAEHMPDTIPPNTLTINAITGDHWSSRWWANKAANLLSAMMHGGVGVYAEPVTVTGANAFAPLTYAPVDALTTMEVIVNGRVFSGCSTSAAFNVVGKILTWTSSLYSVVPGDEVIARYRFSSTLPASSTVVTMTLYYVAVQGQTNFPLNVPDRFANSYNLMATSSVHVSRNGGRLMPDDGSGKGGFTVAGNQVTLLWPAGLDETVSIDVLEQATVNAVNTGGTPPSSPAPGSLWFDSVTAQMYIYFFDGTSSQWVPIVNQGDAGP